MSVKHIVDIESYLQRNVLSFEHLNRQVSVYVYSDGLHFIIKLWKKLWILQKSHETGIQKQLLLSALKWNWILLKWFIHKRKWNRKVWTHFSFLNALGLWIYLYRTTPFIQLWIKLLDCSIFPFKSPCSFGIYCRIVGVWNLATSNGLLSKSSVLLYI